MSSEAIEYVKKPAMEFIRDSWRLVKRCTKPDRNGALLPDAAQRGRAHRDRVRHVHADAASPGSGARQPRVAGLLQSRGLSGQRLGASAQAGLQRAGGAEGSARLGAARRQGAAAEKECARLSLV